jgi:hypothetical protein
MKKKFAEENPHFEELSPEEVKRRDNLLYLSISKDFEIEEKSIKKSKNAKSKSNKRRI